MDLSVIIPARNEEFLQKTIESVVENRRGNTEVIAILDGYWPDEPIPDMPGVTLIHHDKSIGQRAAVNEAARLSTAKYIMKLDGHCSVDEGFDEKLMADCKPDWTVVPRMYNLHAFDWECPECNNRVYQGPKPKKCNSCGHTVTFNKTIVWQPRRHKVSDFMRFDKGLKFQYWYKYHKERTEAKADIADQMAAVGACFFMERDRFFALDGLDEAHGSWGQVGVEVACKSWLSGGKQVVNKKTWFSHMFRTNNNGFSFPYEIKHSEQEKARKYSRDLWLNNKWAKQVRNLDWLIDHFAPVPDWHAAPAKNKGSELLSVIIPARNEKYLQATIDDILANFESKLEIIVGLDDYEPDPPLHDNPRVGIYRSEKRIGMRPMINKLAGMAKGRYLMKVDAHCSFDKGYDTKLISNHSKGVTILGIRYELDVNKWERKERTNCDFRYLSNPEVDELGGLRGLAWHEYKKKTKGQKLAESMSLSGSGWLMEKSQFEHWNGLDENHGTFGQEGCEIACKTWLSGGRLLIDRGTWYAHWNRGKAPYALSRKQRDKSVDYSIDHWLNNKWPLQKYSFNWLLNKFNPPGWDKVEFKGLSAAKQGTNIKGLTKYSVDELWEARVSIAEPLKRYRLELFFNAFYNWLYDQKIEVNPYYNYLVTHLAQKDQDPITDKGHRHVVRKMQGSAKLYQSIVKNGLMAPLEFYAKDGNLILWRGYRRLAILKKLGIKSVAARVHKSERIAKGLADDFSIEKGSINQIGAKQFTEYGDKATDKYYVHNYLKIYDKLFSGMRNKRINILELGVLRGASLAVWHEAFPKAKIFGLDKNVSSWTRFTKRLDRVKVYVGNQDDQVFMQKVANRQKYDIIIDDCGHEPAQQWAAFTALWPALNERGFYIVEDCFRSYTKEKFNLVQELSKWVDSIYNDHEIMSLQFHYNMCVIQKGIKP